VDVSVELGVGLVAWILANWAYLELRRSGRRGFLRILAFFSGWPGTLGTLLVVEEGSRPRLELDDEGLDDLRREIRHDRLRREREEAEGRIPPEASPGPG
jgi:hypothetical protein